MVLKNRPAFRLARLAVAEFHIVDTLRRVLHLGHIPLLGFTHRKSPSRSLLIAVRCVDHNRIYNQLLLLQSHAYADSSRAGVG